jgi:hypothetical protein
MTSSLSSLRLPAALLLGLLAAAVCAGGPVAGCASDGAGTPGGGAAGASGVSGKGGSDEPGGAAGLQGGAGAGGDAGAAANTGAGSGGEAGVSGGGGSPGAAGSGGLAGEGGAGGLAGEGGAVACAPLPAGCPGTAPSFAEEVAPRLHASCWPCHNAGGVQSKRLLTDYAHVMPQRGAILSQLASCLMPPSGSPPLSEADRTVILDWLLCGAPGP